MPLSGGKYVAPHWVNGGPPALDAAELQAMCDTIVKNQGKAAEQQKALEALTNTVGGKAMMKKTSYVGTGNKRTMVTILPFVPTVVFIQGWAGIGSGSAYHSETAMIMLPYGSGKIWTILGNAELRLNVSWSGTRLTLENPSDGSDGTNGGGVFNLSGEAYTVISIA